MKKHNLCFIIDKGYPTSAQRVRYHNFFVHLSKHYSISCTTYSVPFYEECNTVKCYTTIKKGFIAPRLARFFDRILFPDRQIFNLYRFKRSIKQVFRMTQPKDCVIGMAPFSLLFLGSYIKNKYPNINLIADLSDPFSINMRYQTSPVKRCFASLIEKLTFIYFDRIVVLNNQQKESYCTMYPNYADKFTVVEQGIEIDFIEEINKASQPKNHDFTFIYAGSFYKKGRNPQSLFRAFETADKGTKLIIYGNLRKELRPKRSDKIKFHRAVFKEKLINILTGADALIIVDNKYGWQEPGKTLETLAINKPILFISDNNLSPAYAHVQEAEGIVCAENNVESIKNGINEILQYRISEHKFKSHEYSWENMAKKFHNNALKHRDKSKL